MKYFLIIMIVALSFSLVPVCIGAEETGEDISDDLNVFCDDFLMDEDGLDEEGIYDPLEPLNRFFFEFNDVLYYWVMKPVSTGYSAVLPWDVRGCVGNFFTNLGAPIRFLNNILQGKFKDAGIVLSRFLINTTIGVYGFADTAWIEFGMEPKPEDFGQTLGFYGVGEGLYICWPVIGPSNLRDSVGFVADSYTHPIVYMNGSILESAGYYGIDKVNLLSLNPSAYEDMKKYSLDPYIALRQVYYEYRVNKVLDRRERTDALLPEKGCDGF